VVEYLPLKVVAAMDDVVLFPLFPALWSRYTAVSRGLETQPAHSPLVGQQVSTFEVKSPFIDDFDFSKA